MDILEELLQGNPNSVVNRLNTLLSRPRTVREPEDIDEAIQMYEERISELQLIKNEGFTTLSEYNKYKDAQELLAEHERRLQERNSADTA